MIKLCQYLRLMDKKFVLIKLVYEELLLKYDDIFWIEVMKSLIIKNKLNFVINEIMYESKGIILNYVDVLKDYGFL